MMTNHIRNKQTESSQRFELSLQLTNIYVYTIKLSLLITIIDIHGHIVWNFGGYTKPSY